MSEADVIFRLSVQTARFTAAMGMFSRMIGYEVLPAMQKMNALLKTWHQTWPGMPYTVPSIWDPKQMIAAKFREVER